MPLVQGAGSSAEAGNAVIGQVKITNGTLTVSVLDLTNSDPLTVAIVDGSGTQITSFGGGTQHATNDPYTDTDVGTLALAVRQDVQADLGADGDFVPLSIDANGALRVAGGGGGTEYAVDDALGATPTGKLSLAIRDDALSALTPVEGDAIGLRVNANGALWVIPSGTTVVSGTVTADAGTNLNTSTLLTTAAHDAAFGTAGVADAQVRTIQGVASMTPVQVSQATGTNLHAVLDSGTLTTVTTVTTVSALGVGTTGPQKAEDVASANGDMGIAVYAIRDDTLNIRSDTEGDYEPFHTNADGALWVKGVDDAAALTALQLIDDAIFVDDTATHATGTTKGVGIMAVAVPTDTAISANDIGMVGMSLDRRQYVESVGNIAHDTADAGNPVKVGAIAYSPDGTTPGTAVAELDRTNLKTDLDGLLFTSHATPRAWHYHDDDAAAVTTDGTLQADPGDGFAVFIETIVFSIGAATASTLFIEEGSTKIWGPHNLPAQIGAGFKVELSPPLRCTASTAILITNTGSIVFAIDVDGFVAAV